MGYTDKQTNVRNYRIPTVRVTTSSAVSEVQADETVHAIMEEHNKRKVNTCEYRCSIDIIYMQRRIVAIGCKHISLDSFNTSHVRLMKLSYHEATESARPVSNEHRSKKRRWAREPVLYW